MISIVLFISKVTPVIATDSFHMHVLNLSHLYFRCIVIRELKVFLYLTYELK